jgi:hypothetical protein
VNTHAEPRRERKRELLGLSLAMLP